MLKIMLIKNFQKLYLIHQSTYLNNFRNTALISAISKITQVKFFSKYSSFSVSSAYLMAEI